MSESARIAELGSNHRLLLFGFWTGDLPDISRLHFLTAAKALPRASRYVLLTHNSTVSSSLLQLLGRCGIDVIALDLPRLMKEHRLDELLRRTPLSPLWGFVQRLAKRSEHLSRISGLGHCHPTMGFTPRSNLVLGGPPPLAALLSDYVRILVSSIVRTDTLYTDIDFAFTRPLDWIFEHRSFVYSWERRPFANSALMFVTKNSSIKCGKLLDLMRQEGTGKPWILFSRENCSAYGLEVLPCDRIDPLWSLANPSGPKFSEFFTCNDDSEEKLALLKNEFDAIHWHNRWNEVPEPGSPYDLWLRELMSCPDHEESLSELE